MTQQQFNHSTTVRELYDALEVRLPRTLSCDWDNDGLSCCPDPDALVRGVLVALDPTEEAVAEAARRGCNVVLTHHPMLFRGIKAVDGENTMSRKVISLVKAGISTIAFHTRLDAADGGVNDILAARLGLLDVVPFGDDGNAQKKPIGRVGTLPAEITLEAFAALVAERLTVPATAEAYAAISSETAEAVRANAATAGDSTAETAENAKITVSATVAQPCKTGAQPQLENAQMAYIPPEAPQRSPIVYAGPGKAVRRVAVLGGSGEDDVAAAIAVGADTYVTGDYHYHTLCDAPYGPINLVEAGHYFTEFPVCAHLAEMAARICPGVPVYVLGGTAVRCIR